MKKTLITMMLVIAAVTTLAQRQWVGELGSGNREVLAADRDARMTKRQLFDFGWQFTHNGKTQIIDLPHDWDIFEGPNSGQGATGTGGGWFEALYLNNQLIGTKQVSRETEFKAVFSVPYKAGTLRAEAGGESVTLKTAGEPARLRLTPDRTVMTADGQSLTFVTVEVLDKEGTPVPEAAIDCEAVVKGKGQLLAFASADLKDTEPYTSPRVKTWKGRALLVIRSMKQKGSVGVSIKSTLPTASLTLMSK